MARDGLNPYQEDDLIYLWKQTFSDNISGEEIQVINTHMHRYVEANSLQSITDYLDGSFDTQLFRSLCVDIARFLPSRYVPDKRTMQANRDRIEHKQLLQVFGEPDYDSPLLSTSKTEQKRKASPISTKDRSDKKRVKSVKKASSASKLKTIPQQKQCKRPGCVSRGTSLTNTHAQCFYKANNAKGFSPMTSLLAKKEKTPAHSKPNPSGPPYKATSSPTREAFKPTSRSSALWQSQERILVRLTAGLAERKDTILVIALAAPKENLFFLKTNHFDHSWLSKLSRLLKHKPQFESWTLTISPSVTIASCMVAEGTIVMRKTVKFMKPFQMSWRYFMKIRTYSSVCSTPPRTLRLQPS